MAAFAPAERRVFERAVRDRFFGCNCSSSCDWRERFSTAGGDGPSFLFGRAPLGERDGTGFGGLTTGSAPAGSRSVLSVSSAFGWLSDGEIGRASCRERG